MMNKNVEFLNRNQTPKLPFSKENKTKLNFKQAPDFTNKGGFKTSQYQYLADFHHRPIGQDGIASNDKLGQAFDANKSMF